MKHAEGSSDRTGALLFNRVVVSAIFVRAKSAKRYALASSACRTAAKRRPDKTRTGQNDKALHGGGLEVVGGCGLARRGASQAMSQAYRLQRRAKEFLGNAVAWLVMDFGSQTP
jgi:hypothetical protein